MTVCVVGSGPACEAIEAAVTEPCEIRASVPDQLSASLAVVVGSVGSPVFSRMNERAQTAPWIAVELGGVGGIAVPGVYGAVSGFDGTTGCYECLRQRVAANTDCEGENNTDPATSRFIGALAGREAVHALSGTESNGRQSVFGRVIEMPHARRRVHPVPYCECAEDRDWSVRTGYTERTVDDARARAEQALDDRVGLIREVGEIESFPVPYYLAQLSDTAGYSDRPASPNAAGCALDWNTAFMKALGEGLERYSAGVYRSSDLPLARSSDLGNDGEEAVLPSAFVRPNGSTNDEPIRWVPGENLATGESIWLPASRVFFPYDSEEPTITTGLGLGNSGAGALIAGLTEIIERDAALIAWYSTYEPLGLAIDDPEYESLVKRARTEGLSVTATLLTQDIDVPVVGVAVHRKNSDWPEFAMGLGASLDPIEAARSACCEALQNWMELRSMGRAEATNAGGRIGHFASRPPATEEFIDPETAIPAASVTERVPDGQNALAAVTARITEGGLTPYAARVTPPDVAAIGFESVRALIPDAQPLFIDEPYFGERAERVPAELGFESRLRREHHPYP